MKQILKYSTYILLSASFVACSGKTEKVVDIAHKVANVQIEQVINPKVTYGVAYDIDSNAYKTVKIGKYEWFAQNLKVTKLNDGTPISEVADNKEWEKSTTPAYCAYKNNKEASAHGLLYNHKAVISNKICPEGWEVPSDSAWDNLTKSFKAQETAAISLKSQTLWDNQKATNESGFSAIPSGYREIDGRFFIMGENGLWWSSSLHNDDNAMYVFIDKNSSVNHSHIRRTFGLSIRCVKK